MLKKNKDKMDGIEKCEDIYIYDKKNKYIDTRFGAGSFILGHTKQFNNKIFEQIERGTLFGYDCNNEEIFKQNLKKYISWYEDFIFCNSGSESIMRAFRIARSFTQKDKIAVLDSFWHGGYDATQFETGGIPYNLVEKTILLPNDNIDECLKILEQNKEDLAMVFCEPIQQLVPHINVKMLETLRDFTKKNNILLGFDEMISGFRMSLGGAQEYLNIYSDIVCYGKIIGGGFPIGVVAFNEKISRHLKIAKPSVRFGGTFSGNPISMFSGNLILNYLVENKDLVYEKINKMTKLLCDSINNFCEENKYPIRFFYVGSFYRIIFTDKKIVSMKERKENELGFDDQKIFFKILKNNGLLTASNPLSFLSYMHTTEDIIIITDIYKKSILEFLT